MPRLLLAAIAGWWLAAPGVVADAPTRACQTVSACRAEVVGLQQAVRWQRAVRLRAEARLHGRMRRVHRPTVAQAAEIASHLYGVSSQDMLRVADCETGGTFDPHAVNRSSGATGAWQFLASTWEHTRWAAWPRTDPMAEALATAEIVSREGWRQWSCGWAAG
jgi:hypothetical protein